MEPRLSVPLEIFILTGRVIICVLLVLFMVFLNIVSHLNVHFRKSPLINIFKTVSKKHTEVIITEDNRDSGEIL